MRCLLRTVAQLESIACAGTHTHTRTNCRGFGNSTASGFGMAEQFPALSGCAHGSVTFPRVTIDAVEEKVKEASEGDRLLRIVT